MRMMLPASHRLAGRATLDPAELASETMIARRSCELLAETSRFFTQRGVRPRLLRSANDDRCMAMVRQHGRDHGAGSLRCEGVVAVPLDGYDFRRRIGLIDGKTPRDDARSALRLACDSAIA
jgi:DNA-binding transcriptional LysR family regulator